MRHLILFLFVVGVFRPSSAQTIGSMSETICDSIKKIEGLNEEELRLAQLSIYHQEMIKYPTLKVDITGLNRPREFNEYNYRINRELLKNCSEFIDQFSLLPLSKILDVEALFSYVQYDSLESSIVEFIYLKKIDLVVISIDEVSPHETIESFANAQLERLKIGARYERGGIVIVVSKTLGAAHIALSQPTQSLLSQSECADLINSDELKNNNSFRSVFNCIVALKKSV